MPQSVPQLRRTGSFFELFWSHPSPLSLIAKSWLRRLAQPGLIKNNVPAGNTAPVIIGHP
jgi:hypothetical protein